MAETIDMQRMRYINLFSKISKVPTTKCFIYNNQIFFGVPKKLVSKSIGKRASNVRKISKILGKKIKIIPIPNLEKKEEIEEFIKKIIEPIEPNKIEIKENSLIITAGKQNKAALIGRDHAREKELSEIAKNNLNIEKVKIV